MIDILKPLIRQFMPFAQKQMGFSRPPKLFLRQDRQNAANPMGKTGFYDPENESVTLYITGRHPKDIMRSLAHELMHHTQKCNGEFDNLENMGEEGYAQTNPHMRKMEIQAYQASIVFRDWEDSTKGTIYYEHLQKGDKSSMSTKKWKNQELKSLLAESWGFKMDLSKLAESKKEYDLDENSNQRIFAPNHYCAHHVVHEGKKAVTVDHNWNEKLQEVTEYDLKYEDGSIKRNVHVTELNILEGEKHGKRDHPPVKQGEQSTPPKEEEEEEKEVNEANMVPDGKGGFVDTEDMQRKADKAQGRGHRTKENPKGGDAARKEKEAAAPGMRDQDEDKKKEDKAPMKEAVNKKIQMELKLRRLVREALTKADTLNRK
tara:strand:+ start:3948 stop:5069 length:1122 start_codon:yes stop_codon:yes gene_type:complete